MTVTNLYLIYFHNLLMHACISQCLSEVIHVSRVARFAALNMSAAADRIDTTLRVHIAQAVTGNVRGAVIRACKVN